MPVTEIIYQAKQIDSNCVVVKLTLAGTEDYQYLSNLPTIYYYNMNLHVNMDNSDREHLLKMIKQAAHDMLLSEGERCILTEVKDMFW